MLDPSFLNVSCTCMIVWFPKTWEIFWCLFGVFSIPLTWGSLYKNPKEPNTWSSEGFPNHPHFLFIHSFSFMSGINISKVLSFNLCYSFFHLIKICWGNRQLILPSDFGSLTIPHTSLCMQIRICLLNAVNHLLTWSSNALALKATPWILCSTRRHLWRFCNQLQTLDDVYFPYISTCCVDISYLFPWPCVLRYQSEAWLTAEALPSWHTVHSCPLAPHPPRAPWPRRWANSRN